MDHSISIRHFLIFTRTCLMRAASFVASQPARRRSDGEMACCFFVVRNGENGTKRTLQKRPRLSVPIQSASHGWPLLGPHRKKCLGVTPAYLAPLHTSCLCHPPVTTLVS